MSAAKKGTPKKRSDPSKQGAVTAGGAGSRLGRLPQDMHDKAERFEQLITERVMGSGVELAMIYHRYPKEAETRLRRMELAWHILNGTDGDALTTLLLAVEMVAGFAVSRSRLEDAAWIEARLLHTVRELDDMSSLADALTANPKALVELVDTVQLRGLNARRRSLAPADDDKAARWVAKLGEVLRILDLAHLDARGTESRIRKARRSIGWPSPREQKIRGRRPRPKPAKE